MYMKGTQNTEEVLNNNTEKLIILLERLDSYKYTFIRGIINGVGTFIGATIIAAIVIAILVQVLKAFGIDGYFESFLPKN